MNLATPELLLISIPAAAVLIYLPYLVVAYGRFQVGYDISAPRAVFDKLPDYAKRATWAHQNSFETFMVYTAAAFMAYLTGVNSTSASGAAIAFVISRFLFSAFYILNVPIGRSLMFGVGSAATYLLFAQSLMQKLSS
jgi:uncharacterized MAPEG superfamily protein